MSKKTHIRNPYRRGVIPLAGLTVFFGLLTLLVFGIRPISQTAPHWEVIGLVFTLVFGLFTTSVLLLGTLQVQRIEAFLASERPLIHWTYSQSEWAQIKEQRWQAEHHDWKLQLGCLIIFVALAGLLTGLLIGAEEGFIPTLGSGIVGLLVGALVGSALGALVAAGNQLALVWAERDDEPGSVAIGRREIFANGNYFRAAGRRSYVQRVEVLPGSPVILAIQIKMPPRVRRADEEIWQLLVPTAWVQKTESIRSLLVS